MFIMGGRAGGNVGGLGFFSGVGVFGVGVGGGSIPQPDHIQVETA